MKKLSYWGIIILVMSIFISCTGAAQQADLSVEEFDKAIHQPGIQILDVRTAGEYQSGHLANALLADWNNETEFKERTKSLDKSKPVYVYCLGGGRSSAAAEWLSEKGYKAFNLSGGISAWKRADKPVEAAKEIKQMTMQEFTALIPADKVVLVDFSAVWCPPCKKMEPVLEELRKEQGSKFTFVKIDGGEQTSICKELNIEGFPTFIIYKEGKPVWRKSGIVEMSEFVKEIQ